MNALAESIINRRAEKLGLKLESSPCRDSTQPSYGKYRVRNTKEKLVVFGGDHETYVASLTECAQYINSCFAPLIK